MVPAPAKYFDIPPYRAELFSEKSGWSGVMNAHGVNCLTFVKNGTVIGTTVTSFERAQKIANDWNKK